MGLPREVEEAMARRAGVAMAHEEGAVDMDLLLGVVTGLGRCGVDAARPLVTGPNSIDDPHPPRRTVVLWDGDPPRPGMVVMIHTTPTETWPVPNHRLRCLVPNHGLGKRSRWMRHPRARHRATYRTTVRCETTTQMLPAWLVFNRANLRIDMTPT